LGFQVYGRHPLRALVQRQQVIRLEHRVGAVQTRCCAQRLRFCPQVVAGEASAA